MTSTAAVWVVVPVYGGLALVQRCLRSVAMARNRVAWRLLVIDDASPDPAVCTWLAEWAATATVGVTLRRNARNLGFVQTANRGLAQALDDGADVVLLNSDTQVSHGWLDRLQAAAHRAANVGTATPWSNNATIFSYPAYPHGAELPPGWDVHGMAALCATLLDAQAVEVPTAHGFCMYVRAACLAQTGLFDADAFGRGYGEENDFCMRASALGWRHVHALDVYVQHEGSVSFGPERAALVAHATQVIRTRYPDYDARIQAYLHADPTRAARQRLAAAMAAHAGGPHEKADCAQAVPAQGEGVVRRGLRAWHRWWPWSTGGEQR